MREGKGKGKARGWNRKGGEEPVLPIKNRSRDPVPDERNIVYVVYVRYTSIDIALPLYFFFCFFVPLLCCMVTTV